ncbi:MAG: DHH family phosphoesterase [Thermoguttaceae bacterium]|nr:DHH family phosphoesterase [Thermoguttaceae bacterium]MBR4751836.1 DHH family phosphoesterase [Thermoguttaceae bacterium]
MKGKRWKRQQLAASALCLYRPEKQPTGGKSGDNSLLGFCAIMIKEKENWEWITRPYDSELVSRLAQQTGVEPIVVQTLVGRKVVNPRDIVNFLAPASLSRGLYPPYRLPGCQRASEYLADAIRARKKIVVYGDYDVDGMTATAIILKAIKICGGECSYYVPNRLEEGYGLNCEALKRFREDENADVVVTVDCGITSLKEAQFAKEIGLELVVTDHHTPIVDEETQKQILPDVAAIVHPKYQIDGFPPYPYPEICGSFVAFKLAWGLGLAMEGAEKTSPEMRNYLVQAIGLAALGSIADVMPLQDENRTLVRYALENSFVHNMPLGLKRLVEIAIANPNKKITSEDVGYTLAPRLNAAGREVLNENSLQDQEDQANWLYAKSLLGNPSSLASAGQMGLAMLGVELLVTDVPERANELAPFINNLNATRQKLERRMMSEALKMIDDKYEDAPAFVLASRDWHPGVIGVVAGRIAERFHRPAVMIALREADANAGSARGVPDTNFNLYEALNHCSEYLVRFGGHAAAAGLGVKEANVDAFRDAFCDYVAQSFSLKERVPKLWIDGEFPLSCVTMKTLTELNKLAPFGAENPRPVFAAYGVSVVGSARRVGGGKPRPGSDQPPAQGNVLQARFRQGQSELRAVAFGRGDWADQINEILQNNPNAKFDVAFQVVYNDYFNQVELRLQDWRVAQ